MNIPWTGSAGGGELAGELEPLVEGGVGDGHLVGLLVLRLGEPLQVQQGLPVRLGQHVREVGARPLHFDHLAESL